MARRKTRRKRSLGSLGALDTGSLVIGGGVLIGLGTLAYFFLSKGGGSTTTTEETKPTEFATTLVVTQKPTSTPNVRPTSWATPGVVANFDFKPPAAAAFVPVIPGVPTGYRAEQGERNY